MTTKDYKLIARALRKSFNRRIDGSPTYPSLEKIHLALGKTRLAEHVVDDLVDELMKDNPKFNPLEFTKAVWS